MLAAGVLLLTPENRVLFVKRGPVGDHPGEWSIPGGKVEDGEEITAAAFRELLEETGITAGDGATTLCRTVRGDGSEEVDFTTLLCRVPEELAAKTCDESVGWAWAPITSPPEPLHPGCRAALGRIGADELGIARLMANEGLASPQKYENVWLFDIRITGTGMSYRRKLDEFVWRDPSIYLNDEFLARCNGLAVIVDHTKGGVMSSDDYNKQNVGSVMLPYIKGEEVWGIAKIYDAATAQLMIEKQISTSPAVVFRDPSVNEKVSVDGNVLLIEGKPSLFDNLALVHLGVWDQGSDPKGVRMDGQYPLPFAALDSAINKARSIRLDSALRRFG